VVSSYSGSEVLVLVPPSTIFTVSTLRTTTQRALICRREFSFDLLRTVRKIEPPLPIRRPEIRSRMRKDENCLSQSPQGSQRKNF